MFRLLKIRKKSINEEFRVGDIILHYKKAAIIWQYIKKIKDSAHFLQNPL